MGAIKPSTGSMMTHDKIADRAAEKLVRFIMIIITDEGIMQGRRYCCSSCGHYDAGRGARYDSRERVGLDNGVVSRLWLWL